MTQADRTLNTIHIPFTTFLQTFNFGDRVGYYGDELDAQVKATLEQRHRVAPDDDAAVRSWNTSMELGKMNMLFFLINLVMWVAGTMCLLARRWWAGPCYSYSVIVPRALLLVMALLQATGVAEVIRRASCEQECKRDGCDNDCTPGDAAPSCLCHCPTAPSATPPAIAIQTIAPATQATAITFERAERLHPSPDPREIAHVPRTHAV